MTRSFFKTTIKKLLIFSLRENCPKTEFFLVRIFLSSDQKNSVFEHVSRSVCQRTLCTTHSGRSDYGTLTSMIKSTSCLYICRVRKLLAILIFSQYTSMYMFKNLENASAQALIQLRHWFKICVTINIRSCHSWTIGNCLDGNFE